MKITTVLFDLDGTLLPMDQDVFIKAYFGALAKKLVPYGYDKDALLGAIWAGTKAMVANKGDKLNEDAFWDKFVEAYGSESGKNLTLFNEFYANDFCHVKNSCGYTPKSRELINSLKNKGLRIVLATNPLFPSTATEQRMEWVCLSPSDFELFTTYENSHYCKPNPDYYKEIFEKIGVKAEECLMVGNDVTEDMIAETLGCKVFLLTDCLINKENKDISIYPNGSFEELAKFIDTL